MRDFMRKLNENNGGWIPFILKDNKRKVIVNKLLSDLAESLLNNLNGR